jgi:hypothetical protein
MVTVQSRATNIPVGLNVSMVLSLIALLFQGQDIHNQVFVCRKAREKPYGTQLTTNLASRRQNRQSV